MLNPSFCLPSDIADLLDPDLPPLGGTPEAGFEQLMAETIRSHTRIRRHFTKRRRLLPCRYVALEWIPRPVP